MSVSLALALAALPLLQESAVSSLKVTGPKPLASNERIVYPARAREQAIAGPVRFRIRVSAEGTVESVEVEQVPEAGLGFEEAVRKAVGRWRFEPARSGDVAVPLTVETQLRFQLLPEAEKAIDKLLGEFQQAWNEGRVAAMIALMDSGELLHGQETPSWIPLAAEKSRDWLAARRDADAGSLALELRSIKFLWANLAEVVLQFQRPGSSPEATARTGSVTSYLRNDETRWRIVRFGSRPFEPLKPKRADSPEADSPEPQRAGGEIVPPRKVHHVNPKYPDDAKQKGKQGTVVVECTIDRKGNVTSAEVIFGPAELVRAAQDAVRQWRYTPTLLNGVPVLVIMTVTVNFRLSR
jgi:TonB family protein